MTFVKKIKSLSIGKTFFERVVWITEKSWSCAVGNRDRTNPSGFLSQARDKNTFKKKLYLFTRARSTLWSLIVYHMYIYSIWLYYTTVYYWFKCNYPVNIYFRTECTVRRLLETTHALPAQQECVRFAKYLMDFPAGTCNSVGSHLVESLLQEP
jgi:hypothetical protein